jgi:hypothetical protein
VEREDIYGRMNVPLWHSIFIWMSIGAGVLTVLAGIGTWWTSRILGEQRERQIAELQPRRISVSQRARLVELARQRPNRIGFVSRVQDGESADFADHLAAAFRDAGWNVAPTLRTSTNDFPGYMVLFAVGDEAALAETARFVRSTLQQAGIDCRFEPLREESIGGERQDDTVYITVGRKR